MGTSLIYLFITSSDIFEATKLLNKQYNDIRQETKEITNLALEIDSIGLGVTEAITKVAKEAGIPDQNMSKLFNLSFEQASDISAKMITNVSDEVVAGFKKAEKLKLGNQDRGRMIWLRQAMSTSLGRRVATLAGIAGGAGTVGGRLALRGQSNFWSDKSDDKVALQQKVIATQAYFSIMMDKLASRADRAPIGRKGAFPEIIKNFDEITSVSELEMGNKLSSLFPGAKRAKSFTDEKSMKMFRTAVIKGLTEDDSVFADTKQEIENHQTESAPESIRKALKSDALKIKNRFDKKPGLFGSFLKPVIRKMQGLAQDLIGDSIGDGPTMLKDKYTLDELYQIAKKHAPASASPEDIAFMAALAVGESRGQPGEENLDGMDRSYGLWQINMINKADHPKVTRDLGINRVKKYNLPVKPPHGLLNPDTNAKVAWGIWRNAPGQGEEKFKSRWSAAKDGSSQRPKLDKALKKLKDKYNINEGVIKTMNKKDLKNLVKEVLNENSGKGYAPYPYGSSIRDEEQPKEDYMEDWKAFCLEVIKDEEVRIEVAKVLVLDEELFEDVLDIAGQNQSIGEELLRKIKEAREKKMSM